jgi:DNA polymerase-3 subunit delta
VRVRPENLAENLAENLTGTLAPVYLVCGEEPLQIEESLDAIRTAAREAGFTDRVVLHVDQGFDWGELREYQASMSLFGARRVVDLRMPAGPGREGAEALRAWAEQPSPDNLLLVSAGKLDRKVSAARWFKAVDAVGITVQTWQVESGRLRGWVQQRARRIGLRLGGEAADMLAQRSEGNLLALAQELDKARLIAGGDAELDVETVLDAVADSARFGAFDLVDSALAGNAPRTLRILRSLREEGLQPIQVLGPLAWGLRAATRIRHRVAEGRGLDQAMREAKAFTWQRKQGLIKGAMDRHDPAAWHRILGAAGDVDRVAKGAAPGRAWDELERLCLLVCGMPVLGT